MSDKVLGWGDETGRQWSCAIKLGDAQRLKETQGIDILDPSAMEKLFGSGPLVRIEAIGELSRPQWEAAGLTYQDFVDLLIGTDTSFASATAALRAALSDFFRRLDRHDLAIVVDRAWVALVAEMNHQVELANSPMVGKAMDTAVANAMAEKSAKLEKVLKQLETPGELSGS